MDHVPYPQDPVSPPIEIPYICPELEDYDGLDFINYPVRHGWALVPHSAQWMDCHWEIAAKRAQNWLYFGLLLEVIGPSYMKELFLRQNSKSYGCVIDTSQLPNILLSWSRSVRGNRLKVFRSTTYQELFKRYRDIFWECNMQSERMDQRYPYCRTVTLGIKVLLQSLQNAVSSFSHEDKESISDTNSVLPARLLYLQMIHKGWCISRAIWLVHRYSVIMVNYLAALPCKVVGLTHNDCDPSACVANNVDEETYQTMHSEEHCRCEFRGPDEASMLRLIKAGHIPLISVVIMPNGAPQIEVVKAEPAVKYTAISHVWSGGLGNPAENTLPTCQLVRISRLLAALERPNLPKRKSAFELLWRRSSILRRKLRWHNLALRSQTRYLSVSMKIPEYREDTPVIFWIDTLCVPVRKEHKPFRTQAIRSMDLIYAGAENTLVLDSELQQISHTSQEQMSAHVLCSSWMARCWTLQEARLSQICYVQFAVGLFDLQNTERLVSQDGNDAEREHSWNDLMALKLEAIKWYYTMIPMRDPFYELSMLGGQFLNGWNDLEQRSTSRKEDVHCIFASMLGLNGGDVMALPYEQRMKAILRAQPSLPLGLLFITCPKMEEVTYRWIPSYPGLGVSLPKFYGEMKISTDGVVFDKCTANCMGFLVASSKPRLDGFCLQESSDSEPLWVTVTSDGTSSIFGSSTSIATCYIFGKISQNRVKPALFEKGTTSHRHGARFGVQRHERHVLHLSHECPVRYDTFRQWFFDSEGRYEVDQSDFPLVDAEVLSADQIFQIDCGESFQNASSDSRSFLVHGNQNAEFDPISDVGSWPEVGNRRDLIRDARNENGYDFYGYAGVALVYCIWFVFALSVGMNIARSGHISTIGGPITIMCIRWAFLFAERKMVLDSIDHHTRSNYVQSFSRLDPHPDDANKTWSSVQFKAWHVGLAMSTALVLLLLGALVPLQRWALWMGLAIPVEITIRLVIELLWRKTRFGNVIESWLKKRGWW